MAKKFVVLMVFIAVLIITSVSVFADETKSTTPEAGFTNEEVSFVYDSKDSKNIKDSEIAEIYEKLEDLEIKYGDIFFDEEANTQNTYVTSLNYLPEKSAENQLLHNFSLWVNPIGGRTVILMYIKVDGEYVPLESLESETNIMSARFIASAKVNLKYLGVTKVNEVRFIVFKKDQIDSLNSDNIQIIDEEITVIPVNSVQKTNLDNVVIKPAPTTP